MYRVYLKIFNDYGHSEVQSESKTTTASPIVAEAAFRELISRRDLAGRKAHAAMSLNSRQLNYHRFDREPGDQDYIGPDDEIKLFHGAE